MGAAVGPLAGSPSTRRRKEALPRARRAVSWVAWWTLLMALWVWLDDSLVLAELLAGAGAAAIAATLAELVQYQSGISFRPHGEWVAPAIKLPARLVKDYMVVLSVLWRRIVRGEQPSSRFLSVPTRYGDDSPEGMTRRLLITGGASFTPNTFVLGIDRQGMVVHQLAGRREQQKR
ncbi:MAG TPA: hypothetical protein VFN61_02835 [Acidimicrobiales bacterium]|nr:hypothetical protein [Acidimicrobiales bacterium]